METACLVLVALAVFLLPLILTIVHARKINTLQDTIHNLRSRVAALELQTTGNAPRQPRVAPAEINSPPEPQRPIAAAPPVVQPVTPAAPLPVPVEIAAILTPPPLPPQAAATAELPPPLPPRAPAAARAAIDWEAFMGVKLFAWIGGFVLFLGVVFLVKYSFENNLITPATRIIMGAVIGCGLIAGGWWTARRNFRVPGQSLCATGVLVLYADIFAAQAFYNLISLGAAFGLMSLVTVAGFLLAVKLDAQVVAVLGLLGGFMTPPLLTARPEHPLRLFGYIALLNAGIAAVSIRKRWDYLLLLAGLGTVLMQIAWGSDFNPSKATPGFLIFLGFEAQFLLFTWLRQRLAPPERWSASAAVLLGFVAVGFGFCLLSFPELARRPGYFFGFTFLADIGLLALAMWRRHPARIAAPTGAAVFALLAAWTGFYLQHQLLWWALGAYLLFALIHAGFSVWPPEKEGLTKDQNLSSYVPLLALGLLFLCVWHGETSFAVWSCVLLINVIAIGLALTSRSVIALLIALVLTLITAGLWILTAPPLDESVIGILIVVGGFGVFFATASSFLARKLGFPERDARRHVPALAAAMPFVLLLMLIAKLPIGAPTAVFAVALVLAVVLLALGILSRTSWIAAVALVFTWAVEREWQSLHFANEHALIAVAWYLAFLLVFVAYPFFSAEERAPLPWAIGAISGVLHFWLIFEVVASAYPALRNGLLPALFVLPFAFGVYHLIKKRGVVPASGDARLAWQGGAALFFFSLIFPIQFEREWITLGWALEGLALLALFRMVPHAGLRLVGAGLLCVAFVRLALNPAVLEYHRRTGVRIWNWYLYAYGLTIACLFLGARLVQQFNATVVERVIPRLLYTLGTILAFLLLNIEIADYFSIGPTLTFDFGRNFASDMTYSIAWALFALGLLIVGMKRQLRYVRYAGIGLLVVTLLKLFLHDFDNLSPLYRIGAFMGVAIILIVASFIYQRFVTRAAPQSDQR